MKKYYLGKWKSGQDFAKVLSNFGHETEEEALQELIEMYGCTDFADHEMDKDLTESELKQFKRFSEDTNNWGIFLLGENEETGNLDAAITRTWGGRHFETNQI